MKKKLAQLFAAMVLIAGVSFTVIQPSTVSAVSVCPAGAPADSPVCQADADDNANNLIKTIINLLLFIVGIIAVIMIIVGGFMYITSGGDSGGVTKAKNTILYAVVGLVVAILAYAIVNFVILRVTGP